MDSNTIDKFWRNITKTQDCWLWNKCNHPFGYGIICVGKKRELTHRFSYKLHYGPITSQQCVLHKCDNPQCVNPEHLFIGSRKDNAVDRTNKGRTPKGSQVPTSKLTEQDVRDIRSSELSVRQLSKKYSVTTSNIYAILSRTNWRHIS